MKVGPNIATVAALIGDPARANILTALMSGKALTATELAGEAGVTAQTASTHLAKLSTGGLIVVRKQGRHRYASLASADVAQVLEGLMGLAAGSGLLRRRPGPRDEALREARVCYNHLAGRKGVQLYRSLIGQGHLVSDGGHPYLTPEGALFMETFGVRVPATAKAPHCRDCLDWSAREAHLAGPVGRALLVRLEALGWAARDGSTRIIRFSASGAEAFGQAFPLA